MKAERFDSIVENRLRLIKEILLQKRAEYAPDGGDRLHNFKRAGEMLRTTPERALVGMWTKHIISILDIVDGLDRKLVSVEMIEEKIGDAVNYLILLEAMLKNRWDYSDGIL